MRLGALLGPIVSPEKTTTLAEQARMLEAIGYQSLWSAQAVGRGFMITDPFIALSVAASVTTRCELGTAVVQAPLYAPADLAHRAMSLAQVSGNRLLLGIGAGSTEADFKAFERDFTQRFRRFNTIVPALRDYLKQGGSGDVELSPWPAVRGRVPLFLGSWGAGVDKAATQFDGWIASGHYRKPEEIYAALDRYRAAGGKRAIVSTLILNDKTDIGQLRDLLQGFAAAGFDDAVVMFQLGAPHPDRVRALV